jgi:hypothetical protein
VTSPLEVWYSRITGDDLIGQARDARIKERIRDRIAKPVGQDGSTLAYRQLAGLAGGRVRIRGAPLLIYDPDDRTPYQLRARLEENMAIYLESLSNDRRKLLDRYRPADAPSRWSAASASCAWSS